MTSTKARAYKRYRAHQRRKNAQKDYFTEIKNVLVEAGENDLAAVIDHEIELLANKAVKNKERAAARKVAGDEFAVESVEEYIPLIILYLQHLKI